MAGPLTRAKTTAVFNVHGRPELIVEGEIRPITDNAVQARPDLFEDDVEETPAAPPKGKRWLRWR